MTLGPVINAPQLIRPETYLFAENLTLDLHDLAAILLRERILSEPCFKHSQLYEICNGNKKASCLRRGAQALWTSLPGPKVGYFLKQPTEVGDDEPPAEPQTFLHKDFKSKDNLSERDLETIFWRVKHHDSGFVLAHALQLVLDALPASTMLRVRTSQGHSIECKARSNAVAEMTVLPTETSYICNIRMCPDLGPYKADIDEHYTGDGSGSLPWLYLIFGEESDATGDFVTDKRVALDLVAPMLGMRGLGDEVFIMERIGSYHQDVLPQAARDAGDYVISGRIFMADMEKASASVEISRCVLGRLELIVRGEATFCAYCGRDGVKPRCSGCLGKTKYCDISCQKRAWKYHKAWCKADIASKQAHKK